MADNGGRLTSRGASCIICMQHLCKPKLLPCLHASCEECLREFVVGRLYDTVGHFPCPRCGRTTHLPPEGVCGFPNGNSVGSADLAGLMKEPTPVPVLCNDLILSFSRYGTGIADLTQPLGLAVKANREIIVTDRSTNRILTFGLQGEVKSVFACCHSISDVAVTSHDTVVVASPDPGQPLAIEYNNRTGARLRSFGRFNSLEITNGVAVIDSPFAVVVSSFETGTVHVLSETGRLLRKFSRRAVTGQAHHLCASSAGSIIVSDYANSRIVVIDRLTGSCMARMGGIGTGAGSLYQPLGICVDNEDNIIVADSGNRRVVVFSAHGIYRGIVTDMSLSIGKPCNVACVPNTAMLIVLVKGHHYAQVRVYSYHPEMFCNSRNSRNSNLLSLCVC